jgi:hypothetical protein
MHSRDGMKIKLLVIGIGCVLTAFPDTVILKSGPPVKGIVQRMEAGKVTITVDGQPRTLDILAIDHIEFDTPHFTDAAQSSVDDHFKGSWDVKEMNRLATEMRKAQQETEAMLRDIKTRWQNQRELDRNQTQLWAAERERFSSPLARYRAALDEIYLHVAAQVDEYNRLAKDGNAFYIGVRGLLNTGSPLVQQDKRELDPKEVLPRGWWDQIYYQGYTKGFKDAKEFDRLTP